LAVLLADEAADVAAVVALALELADELLLLLLPHAATVTAHDSKSAASSGFLRIDIRLLLSLRTPGREGDQDRKETQDGKGA
jgi:hypothetical protein